MATYNQSDILYSSATTTYNQVSATISRTATGSGVGTQTATGIRVKVRTATGSGAGTQTATGVHIKVRTATGAGTGTQTASGQITPVRTAQGSGSGASSVTFIRTPIRTATGSGVGTETAVDLVINIRTATGSGTGTSATLSGLLITDTATGAGTGTQTADWVKSRIFRVPYTYNYPGGYFGGGDAANRLGRYNRSGVRARNLYELTNGEYTIVDQRDLGQVAKLWYGGRDYFLNDAEVAELTAAGFGDSIT